MPAAHAPARPTLRTIASIVVGTDFTPCYLLDTDLPENAEGDGRLTDLLNSVSFSPLCRPQAV